MAQQIEIRVVITIAESTMGQTYVEGLMPLLSKWVHENIPPQAPDMPKPKVTVTVQPYPRKETLT
jgi:hypothetical protein